MTLAPVSEIPPSTDERGQAGEDHSAMKSRILPVDDGSAPIPANATNANSNMMVDRGSGALDASASGEYIPFSSNGEDENIFKDSSLAHDANIDAILRSVFDRVLQKSSRRPIQQNNKKSDAEQESGDHHHHDRNKNAGTAIGREKKNNAASSPARGGAISSPFLSPKSGTKRHREGSTSADTPSGGVGGSRLDMGKLLMQARGLIENVEYAECFSPFHHSPSSSPHPSTSTPPVMEEQQSRRPSSRRTTQPIAAPPAGNSEREEQSSSSKRLTQNTEIIPGSTTSQPNSPRGSTITLTQNEKKRLQDFTEKLEGLRRQSSEYGRMSLSTSFGREGLHAMLIAPNNPLIKRLIGLMLSGGIAIFEVERVVRLIACEADLDKTKCDILCKKALSDAVKTMQSSLASETGLGFLSRDAGGKREEDVGIITFACIHNDGQPHNLKALITLKNIFSRQLPKMPKEYISRLVLDPRHFSYLLVKQHSVIGGVCFRPFFEKEFAEIAFLAITAQEQVKGYGTRLMNHLKEYVKKMPPDDSAHHHHHQHHRQLQHSQHSSQSKLHSKTDQPTLTPLTSDTTVHPPHHASYDSLTIKSLVTYADNFAIGYFQKQGFTKHIATPKETYSGYIKEYDGGTLMECRLLPQINYRAIGRMLHLQKQAIWCGVSNAHEEPHPGITDWPDNSAEPRHPSSIPGLVESGWRPAARTRQNKGGPGGGHQRGGGGGTSNIDSTSGNGAESHQQGPSQILQEGMLSLVKVALNMPDSWPFKKPVTPEEAPDYLDHITHPTDLSTILQKIKKNEFPTKASFVEEFNRMFDNCRQYNSPDSPYYNLADKVQNATKDKLEALQE